MHEYKFIEKLSESASRKEDGKAYMEKLKSASSVGNLVAAHKDKLLAGAIGSGIIGGLTYATSKKNKITGKSKNQDFYDRAADNSNRSIQETRANGKTPGFVSGYKNVIVNASKGMSDVAADHPIRTSLVNAPLYGIPLGLTGKWILNILKK